MQMYPEGGTKEDADIEILCEAGEDYVEDEDPFARSLDEEEPPEPNDDFFRLSRRAIRLRGRSYQFMKPPYMNYPGQTAAKKKLKEAYSKGEFLMLYGHSGSGKSTLLSQFCSQFPNYIHLIDEFSSISPARMIQRMGECINLPLKQRKCDLEVLISALMNNSRTMFLFDNVDLDSSGACEKLNILCRIYKKTHIPICICGVNYLYKTLYDDKYYDRCCSAITQLDFHKLKTMTRNDAANYLCKVQSVERVRFSFPAREMLIKLALMERIGCTHAFTTVIGRAVTISRALYYDSEGHSFPDEAACLLLEDPDEEGESGAKRYLTLPPTPEVIPIGEGLVIDTMDNYKSMLREESKRMGGRESCS